MNPKFFFFIGIVAAHGAAAAAWVERDAPSERLAVAKQTCPADLGAPLPHFPQNREILAFHVVSTTATDEVWQR
jgi:hypothetical protein